jgi:hypothetical protein
MRDRHHSGKTTAPTIQRPLDGTKIKANASKHKAMSYERMKTRETELRAEVDRWLEAAEAADAQEDKRRCHTNSNWPCAIWRCQLGLRQR